MHRAKSENRLISCCQFARPSPEACRTFWNKTETKHGNNLW